MLVPYGPLLWLRFKTHFEKISQNKVAALRSSHEPFAQSKGTFSWILVKEEILSSPLLISLFSKRFWHWKLVQTRKGESGASYVRQDEMTSLISTQPLFYFSYICRITKSPSCSHLIR